MHDSGKPRPFDNFNLRLFCKRNQRKSSRNCNIL